MQALTGVKVVELGRFIAAPYCAQLLGDAGADVIKIEPLLGDESQRGGRRISETCASQFINKNRNKRSLACDLKNPTVIAAVKSLMANADVIVANMRPKRCAELGIGYEAVSEINPRIIYAENTAFGSRGSMADMPGMDIALQGYTGLANATDEGPTPISEPIVDYTAALLLAWGISTALFHRSNTGRGQRLEVSLLHAALVLQNNSVYHVDAIDNWRLDYVDYLKTAFSDGHSWQDVINHKNTSSSVPLTEAYYGFFQAKDGVLCVAGGGSLLRKRIAQLIEVRDVWLETNTPPEKDRYEYVQKQRRKVAQVIQQRTVDDWLQRFRLNGIPASIVQLQEQIVDDQQVLDNECVTKFEHPQYGGMTVVAPPLRFSDSPLRVNRPPPGLGEHGAEILSEAGVDEQTISLLVEQGAVHIDHEGT